MRYTQVVHVGGIGGATLERTVEADWLPRGGEYVLLAPGEGRAQVASVFHTAHVGTLVSMRAPYTDKQADWTPQQRVEETKALGFKEARPAVKKVVMA